MHVCGLGGLCTVWRTGCKCGKEKAFGVWTDSTRFRKNFVKWKSRIAGYMVYKIILIVKVRSR